MIELITLRVLKVNPARGLYERLGFSVIRETETHYFCKGQTWVISERYPLQAPAIGPVA